MGMIPKDVEAEVIFLLPDEGGRENPVFNGFRPHLFYDGTAWTVQLIYENGEIIPQGVLVKIFFAFVCPESQVDKLYPGKNFELREIKKVITKGTVTRLIDLEESA